MVNHGTGQSSFADSLGTVSQKSICSCLHLHPSSPRPSHPVDMGTKQHLQCIWLSRSWPLSVSSSPSDCYSLLCGASRLFLLTHHSEGCVYAFQTLHTDPWMCTAGSQGTGTWPAWGNSTVTQHSGTHFGPLFSLLVGTILGALMPPSLSDLMCSPEICAHEQLFRLTIHLPLNDEPIYGINLSTVLWWWYAGPLDTLSSIPWAFGGANSVSYPISHLFLLFMLLLWWKVFSFSVIPNCSSLTMALLPTLPHPTCSVESPQMAQIWLMPVVLNSFCNTSLIKLFGSLIHLKLIFFAHKGFHGWPVKESLCSLFWIHCYCLGSIVIN